jgi:TonB family protein
MKPSYLALISAVVLIVILTMSWCGRKPVQSTGIVTPAQPLVTPASSPAVSLTPTMSPTASAILIPSPSPTATPTPGPSLTPSAEMQKTVKKIGPAIISISVFGPSGQLLHTGTGFYISGDGQFVTNWHAVDGGAHAVAKSVDGKIRNVVGVISSSPELDLAVLKAETKIGVPFLRLGKGPPSTTAAAVVGSSLTHREQPLAVVELSLQSTSSSENLLVTSARLSADNSGAPLINENGEVVGVTTITKDSSGVTNVVVRPASALASLLARTTPETVARWAGAEEESPTPSPTPKKLRIVSNPAPVYPEQARRAKPPMGGSGRFRIVFDANGQAREVQIVRSTGQNILDQAAVDAFYQWKSEPGHDWSLVVPITFRP